VKIRPPYALIAFAALGAAPFSLSIAGDQPITEFEASNDDKLEWRIVDDGVMGGLSKGKISFTDSGTMKFSGKLSLENNGGFSSVRTTEVDLDLLEREGLAMRVKGDRRTYQLRLNTDARYRSWDVSSKPSSPPRRESGSRCNQHGTESAAVLLETGGRCLQRTDRSASARIGILSLCAGFE
jgi:hypothetical protein